MGATGVIAYWSSTFVSPSFSEFASSSILSEISCTETYIWNQSENLAVSFSESRRATTWTVYDDVFGRIVRVEED